MYIPKHFKIENPELTLEFISRYNFGLMLCNGGQAPVATHLPFYHKHVNGELILFTHLAKANPQWQVLSTQGSCLVVFTGPDGYVSPSLYSSKQNVPTWNYLAVHITGTPEIVQDEKLVRELMHETIVGTEREFLDRYNELSSEYLQAMYNALVFITIRITSIETKFKLSQNKPEEDRRKVADRFEELGNNDLAQWMRRINNL